LRKGLLLETELIWGSKDKEQLQVRESGIAVTVSFWEMATRDTYGEGEDLTRTC
jgi:hypothetical protein